jgi:hypothetical protein
MLPVSGILVERTTTGIRWWSRKRRGGRFFGRRVNCEGVPLLPAWAVAWMLDDPRKIPYLLIWKSEYDGAIKQAVRIAREISHVPPFDLTGWIEIKRHDGTRSSVRPALCPLPRNGGRVRLLILSVLSDSAPRAVWMAAGRTVHKQCGDVFLAMPELRRAALCLRRRRATDSRAARSCTDPNGCVRSRPFTAPRVLAPLRVHLN